ncbi:MAG: hypothetical protein II748_03030 [Clostridia bacterium]|nr:hypothetical protein [Clostridia bacterium]
MTKETFKDKLKKVLKFIFNPRLLLCVAIAWMITNGWSYVLLGIGTFFGIHWMTAVAGAYLTALWFPFTPEKIVTFAIAIFLLRVLFPKDEKTLKYLIDLKNKAVEKFKEDREKFKSRRAEKKKAREEKRAAKKAAKQKAKTDPDDAAKTEQEL